MANMQEIIQSLEPVLSTLSDLSTKDRPAKRRAIETLEKETSRIKSWEDASTVSIELLEYLVDSLLTFSESGIETVREHTVITLRSLIKGAQKGKIKPVITEKIMTVAMKRMGYKHTVTGKVIIEPTEEIRAEWMQLCVLLIDLIPDTKMKPAETENCMKIMQLAGEDPFHEIQKINAQLFVILAKNQPKSVDYSCDRMVRLLIPLLVHKYTAVRVLGIKSMEDVLMASPKGLHVLFEYDEELDRQPVVPALVYDTSALVRDQLFIGLGNLLCHWPAYARYQYGDRILPIILAGTFDELPSVQETCKTSLFKVASSCTQDLLDAGIITTIPEDNQEKEKTGLKHLIHICYQPSLLYLLQGTTDFIVRKQCNNLDSLQLFLSYVSTDDLVGSIKKLIHYLMIAYIQGQSEEIIKSRILNTVLFIASNMPSPDIYLDAILFRLDRKYMISEKSGYSGSIILSVVVTFLSAILSSTPQYPSQHANRVLSALKQPHIKNYIDNEYCNKQQLDALKEQCSSFIDADVTNTSM